MGRSRLQGRQRVKRLMKQLPDSVSADLSRTLEAGAKLILVAMRARTPRKTGLLQSYLKWKSYLKGLRVRVGLIGSRKRYGDDSLSDVFYGRIQNYGRAARTVMVTRRLARKIRGNGSAESPRRVLYRGKPYPLKVRAMAPKLFVTGRYPEFRRIIGDRLRGTWTRALKAIGG